MKIIIWSHYDHHNSQWTPTNRDLSPNHAASVLMCSNRRHSIVKQRSAPGVVFSAITVVSEATSLGTPKLGVPIFMAWIAGWHFWRITARFLEKGFTDFWYHLFNDIKSQFWEINLPGRKQVKLDWSPSKATDLLNLIDLSKRIGFRLPKRSFTLPGKVRVSVISTTHTPGMLKLSIFSKQKTIR